MSRPTSIKDGRGRTHTGKINPKTGEPLCSVARKRTWCYYCSRVDPITHAGRKVNALPGSERELNPMGRHRPNGVPPLRSARKARHVGDVGWTAEMRTYMTRSIETYNLGGLVVEIESPSMDDLLEALRESHPDYYDALMGQFDRESAEETAHRLGVARKTVYNRRTLARARLDEMRNSRTLIKVSAPESQKEGAGG